MSPKSTFSRSLIIAVLALTGAALGGCAESTSGRTANSRDGMEYAPIPHARLGDSTMRTATASPISSESRARGLQHSGGTGGVAAGTVNER
jgi:hypothetical protein